MRLTAALAAASLVGCSLIPGGPSSASDTRPAAATFAAASPAATAPAATPQRPGLSFDSNTTAPGTFELELGATVDFGDTRETPLTLKYGAGPRTEVWLGWTPYVQVKQRGTDDTGVGDSALGIRHRFHEADDWAAAAQVSAKFPTGSHSAGITNGEVDVYAAVTANGARGPWFWTTYYQFGLLGQTDGHGRDSQHGVALVGGRSLNDRMSALLEVAGLFSHALDDPVFTTAAVTWSRDPSVVWDAGVELGLNDAAADARLFLGATINFGR